ncbi:hypothetical protein [Bacillus sp. B15-48]|uniref:hypothetical protein n=1 Tax=Bacillus sp. B15-48 TaxID=1548601 RepID=UPI00193F4721|nr:hypothetical protein [Bacillus sp. B15-48]MBM4764836.1 hypothetical protein [Bacillus sp. B15-48]
MEETLKLILNELKELKVGQQKLIKEQQELKGGQQKLIKEQQELKGGQQKLIEEQQELKKDISSIKDNLINGLGPYFEHIEKHIDQKTAVLKDTLEDQQLVIDTLAARSIKHESEIKDFKRILKNQ